MTAKMVTLDELLDAATALVPKPMALDVGEPVDTDIPEDWNLLNHTLGEPIIAEGDLPPFDRSTMDGFALRHGDYAATMPCAGRIDAGQGEAITVPAGACISIATGAPVPADLDTVIPHERTRREGDDIHFDGSPEQGANVHRQGVDARRGDTLVRSGTVLGPAEIGLMAACGMTSAAMRRHLFATVFTSGDEVVAADATPLPDQIRNSNGPMVCAILARLHGSVSHRHLPDDLNATIDKLRPTDDPDHLIVTTGGISAGERDFIPAALEALGVEWTLIGAAVKPGKPVRLGRLGPMPVVCLPGNPVAALIMGTIVLGRVTAALFGNEPPTWSFGELATDVAPNARRELLRTAIERDGRLHVGAWHGSGDLVHTAGMNAIIRLPKGDNVLKAGTQVSMLRT